MQGKEASLLTEKRPVIARALRRSSIRRKIIEYLFNVGPSGSYASEIAYHIKTTPTNVIGAIRGMGNRYRKKESLLDLQIVEEINRGRDMKLYRLTDFGKEIAETLKNDKIFF